MDQEKLALLLDELVKVPDIDIETIGFELPEVEQLLADIINGDEVEGQFDISEELEADKPIVTQPGDIIKLGLHGEHKLLCGDATKISDIAKLMGDHRSRLCHTDPPYNVSYNRNNRPSAKKAKNSTPKTEGIRNDDLSPKHYEVWFRKVVNALAEAMISGAPFYIWNSHKNFGLMHDLLSKRNFKISSVITWAKESFAPGFGDYNEQTEFCLYGWKGGAKHYWYGPKNESTLWQIHRDLTKEYKHPTQKPLELAERAMRNSSRRGQIVLDTFLGSGTTLIAAEKLSRKCLGVEIDAHYCDVIVRRWIAFVGIDNAPQNLVEKYCVGKFKEVQT